MAGLKEFDAFLAGRQKVIDDTEKRLCALQSKYESFFSEVNAVRESELGQLSGHLAAGRDKLPGWLAKAVDEAQAKVEKEFDDQLAKLQAERDGLARAAESLRLKSVAAEEAIHQKNVDLDAAEEKLKARNEELLQKIDSYNAKIHELGSGFGFFKNLFAMSALGRERRALDEEQASVAAQIDRTRAGWVEREQGYTEAETALQKSWVEANAKTAAAQAKLDALGEARPRMVFRTVAERVLYGREPKQATPAATDPKCPRCQSANPAANHFCQICAGRLQPDRPDLEGSLEEIAEANYHFARFSEGMKACQQVIALVRGLQTGIAAFRKSVFSMVASQASYSLATLQIDVPKECVAWGQGFQKLFDAAQPGMSLHPKNFGDQMLALVAADYTEAKVKAWFERMGTELSVQAKSQWG